TRPTSATAGSPTRAPTEFSTWCSRDTRRPRCLRRDTLPMKSRRCAGDSMAPTGSGGCRAPRCCRERRLASTTCGRWITDAIYDLRDTRYEVRCTRYEIRCTIAEIQGELRLIVHRPSYLVNRIS